MHEIVPLPPDRVGVIREALHQREQRLVEALSGPLPHAACECAAGHRPYLRERLGGRVEVVQQKREL